MCVQKKTESWRVGSPHRHTLSTAYSFKYSHLKYLTIHVTHTRVNVSDFLCFCSYSCKVCALSFNLTRMRPPSLSNNTMGNCMQKQNLTNFPLTIFEWHPSWLPRISIAPVLNLTRGALALQEKPFLSSIAGSKRKKYCCSHTPRWPSIKDAGDGCRRGCQSGRGLWGEQKAGGGVTQPWPGHNDQDLTLQTYHHTHASDNDTQGEGVELGEEVVWMLYTCIFYIKLKAPVKMF